MSTKEKVIQRLLELRLVQNKEQAEHWLLKEQIPSFDNKTAAQLIVEGRADAVFNYIERLDKGGYA